MQLNEALLEQLKLRLVDKESRIIGPQGKLYIQREPVSECLMGSVGPLPDPTIDWSQSPNSMGIVTLLTPSNNGSSKEILLSIGGQFDLVHRYVIDINDMRDNHLKMVNNVPTNSQVIPFCYLRNTVCFDELMISITLPDAVNEWCSPDSGNSLERALTDLSERLKQDPRVYKQCFLQASGYVAKFVVTWRDAEVITQDDLNDLVKREIFEDISKVLPYEILVRARARKAPPSISNVDNAYLVEIFSGKSNLF